MDFFVSLKSYCEYWGWVVLDVLTALLLLFEYESSTGEGRDSSCYGVSWFASFSISILSLGIILMAC